ncbi:MAG TPA: hypothetical protein PKA77_02815 [Chitinophagaceae bacterium]|jgi:hypothetical protein|nr:hypothetical protein [Chitinophagaceae bacterium]HMU56998.1 hypothetical protein [Chitinophagaceae bacterium]
MRIIKNIKILAVILFGGMSAGVYAQGETVDTARNIALNFFRTYDSIPYLTFDVRYSLFSDTVYSDFSYEAVKGVYTLNRSKARYTIGDVEYLQNDSFLLAVYHKDQQIIVANPTAKNAGSYVPLRETLDSLLQAYSANYYIWVKSIPVDPDTDTTGYIKLEKKPDDTVAVYNRYTIEFDIAQNLITKIEYEYTEPGLNLTADTEPDEGQRLLKNTARRKTLRIEFFNYRFDNFSDSYYSENNFIWQEDGEYKPVEKYRDYGIVNARN